MFSDDAHQSGHSSSERRQVEFEIYESQDRLIRVLITFLAGLSKLACQIEKKVKIARGAQLDILREYVIIFVIDYTIIDYFFLFLFI
jgi:hypothetical protein